MQQYQEQITKIEADLEIQRQRFTNDLRRRKDGIAFAKDYVVSKQNLLDIIKTGLDFFSRGPSRKDLRLNALNDLKDALVNEKDHEITLSKLATIFSVNRQEHEERKGDEIFQSLVVYLSLYEQKQNVLKTKYNCFKDLLRFCEENQQDKCHLEELEQCNLEFKQFKQKALRLQESYNESNKKLSEENEKMKKQLKKKEAEQKKILESFVKIRNIVDSEMNVRNTNPLSRDAAFIEEFDIDDDDIILPEEGMLEQIQMVKTFSEWTEEQQKNPNEPFFLEMGGYWTKKYSKKREYPTSVDFISHGEDTMQVLENHKTIYGREVTFDVLQKSRFTKDEYLKLLQGCSRITAPAPYTGHDGSASGPSSSGSSSNISLVIESKQKTILDKGVLENEVNKQNAEMELLKEKTVPVENARIKKRGRQEQPNEKRKEKKPRICINSSSPNSISSDKKASPLALMKLAAFNVNAKQQFEIDHIAKVNDDGKLIATTEVKKNREVLLFDSLKKIIANGSSLVTVCDSFSKVFDFFTTLSGIKWPINANSGFNQNKIAKFENSHQGLTYLFMNFVLQYNYLYLDETEIPNFITNHQYYDGPCVKSPETFNLPFGVCMPAQNGSKLLWTSNQSVRRKFDLIEYIRAFPRNVYPYPVHKDQHDMWTRLPFTSPGKSTFTGKYEKKYVSQDTPVYLKVNRPIQKGAQISLGFTEEDTVDTSDQKLEEYIQTLTGRFPIKKGDYVYVLKSYTKPQERLNMNHFEYCRYGDADDAEKGYLQYEVVRDNGNHWYDLKSTIENAEEELYHRSSIFISKFMDEMEKKENKFGKASKFELEVQNFSCNPKKRFTNYRQNTIASVGVWYTFFLFIEKRFYKMVDNLQGQIDRTTISVDVLVQQMVDEWYGEVVTAITNCLIPVTEKVYQTFEFDNKQLFWNHDERKDLILVVKDLLGVIENKTLPFVGKIQTLLHEFSGHIASLTDKVKNLTSMLHIIITSFEDLKIKAMTVDEGFKMQPYSFIMVKTNKEETWDSAMVCLTLDKTDFPDFFKTNDEKKILVYDFHTCQLSAIELNNHIFYAFGKPMYGKKIEINDWSYLSYNLWNPIAINIKKMVDFGFNIKKCIEEHQTFVEMIDQLQVLSDNVRTNIRQREIFKKRPIKYAGLSL